MPGWFTSADPARLEAAIAAARQAAVPAKLIADAEAKLQKAKAKEGKAAAATAEGPVALQGS